MGTVSSISLLYSGNEQNAPPGADIICAVRTSALVGQCVTDCISCGHGVSLLEFDGYVKSKQTADKMNVLLMNN